MRLNSYVSGLSGIGDDNDSEDYWAGVNDAINAQPIYGSESVSVSNFPSVSDPNAGHGWSNLLQSIIGTGVRTASQIAVTQNAVPQLAPGTYYNYNAKTGSYVMGANQPGQASLISSNGTSILNSPVALLGIGVLAVIVIAKAKR